VALRIKGKGSVLQDVPVTRALSSALLEWKDVQEGFEARRLPGGIAFAALKFVWRRIRASHFPTKRSTCGCAACRALGLGRSQRTDYATRRRPSLNHVGKDLREIQELLRHKNIRTTVRYTDVGYEQIRHTAEALSQALE
jgi:site-specific recombinase XerC